ncbi:hypothetical protein FOZ60_003232 [Perkinsus olseni]|uniref:Uncharacterized protein n=1 Tax=Perkinsus olseni TaxID=32597 RepID=A0A7J6NVX2_PEROL|nr:hypothetical protein FOZ60_003232 [Perkinsus olseni]
MVNFLSSLLTVQPLLVTAQYVGRYMYETEDFRMIFDVNDDHEADFTFKAHPRPGVTPEGSTSFSTGMVPLENFSDSGYLFALGKRGPGYATFTNLYNAIGHYLSKAGIIQPDDSFPPAGIQHGDLTLLTYTDSDHISTDFQGEEALSLRKGHCRTSAQGVAIGLPHGAIVRDYADTEKKAFYIARKRGDLALSRNCTVKSSIS